MYSWIWRQLSAGSAIQWCGGRWPRSRRWKQAAKIGGVSLLTLIEKLRAFNGQSCAEASFAADADDSSIAPDWEAEGRVVEEVDAAAMLEVGVHPIGKIREAFSALGARELLVLRAPVRPEPLLDTMCRAGAQVYCTAEGESHVAYFARAM